MTLRAIGGAAPAVAILLLGSSCAPGGASGPAATLVIEGVITGLTGSGLVLENNGGNGQTLPPSAPGFVFQNIAEGASYSVTVKAQPTAPSQTCTVSNGTGVARDAVRNVTIACITNSFAVRGNISGLTGTGLAVSLNGGGSQSIAAGAATFAFPPVPSGTQYTVTVIASPPGQVCVVGNGTGVVGTGDVTSVAIACGAPGLSVGGGAIGVGRDGLVLLLNGTTALAIPANTTSFTFPVILQTGSDYSVTVIGSPTGPPASCGLARARGRVGGGNISDVQVRCFLNSGLDSYTGTYAVAINGRRNYLTLWFDGTFSFALRLDDASCTNNGNGSEYGIYKRVTSGAFSIHWAMVDNNGGCGLWSGVNLNAPTPGAGFEGTMVRNGDVLTLVSPEDGTITTNAVESVPTSLIGAFTRTDGVDGSFIIFEADGTYLYQEAQQTSGAISNPAGFERGCYLVTGSTFTTSLAASCRPDGLPALDLNGTAGFSGRNGASIPFVITSGTSITIDARVFNRVVPAG